MFLLLSHDKTLSEVQHFFTSKYPYLKIEFYKKQDREQLAGVKRTHLSPSMTLKASGLEKNEVIDISKDMTVADLENIFSQSGLNVQVSRRSGIVWLETTMTDQWSLEKQNEHGREISVPAGESKPGDKI
ncbi:MAG: hypothetical protein EOO01_26555 [Chitinophagaceae bacterium]|nr:MAG: hypothetical protein EOO01_26555 [Chitinophagaceae bacterium]